MLGLYQTTITSGRYIFTDSLWILPILILLLLLLLTTIATTATVTTTTITAAATSSGSGSSSKLTELQQFLTLSTDGDNALAG